VWSLGGTQELTALRKAHQRCEAAALAGDSDEYYYENDNLHDCTYAASHNAFLASEARQLRQRLKPYRRLQLQARQRVDNSLSEHQTIVEAIEQGDPMASQRALSDHVLIQDGGPVCQPKHEPTDFELT
jgi:DNA-binding GntR family transcriptional regulator